MTAAEQPAVDEVTVTVEPTTQVHHRGVTYEGGQTLTVPTEVGDGLVLAGYATLKTKDDAPKGRRSS